MSTRSAGWYVSPDRLSDYRYWDGQRWTDMRRSDPPPAPPLPAQSSSAVPILLAGILAVLVIGGAIGGYLLWRSHQHHADVADNIDVERQIQLLLREQFNDESLVVVCNGPLLEKAGYISDCTGSASGRTQAIRVTMDDDQGHFQWRLVAPITLVPLPRGA